MRRVMSMTTTKRATGGRTNTIPKGFCICSSGRTSVVGTKLQTPCLSTTATVSYSSKISSKEDAVRVHHIPLWPAQLALF